MSILWMIPVMHVALVLPLNVQSRESSEDYLRKVMNELQELKAPPQIAQGYPDEAYYLAGKRFSGSNSNVLSTVVHQLPDIPRRTMDSMETSSSNHQYYQQIPASGVIPTPSKILGEPLAFTKNELAAVYKQALESGNALSISSLMDALSRGHLPSVVGNQLQLPSAQQQTYMYYFYPLKSFMDNLQNNHGYKTINDLTPESTGAFQESQKQIVVNPLFMAISGFLGMAVLFMVGVLVLPKIFGEFKSRLVHDELLDLTKTVSEAIDNYNSTTTRPKTRGTVVGIKTRPGNRGAARRRRKTQQGAGGKTT